MQETWVRFLGQEHALEDEMAGPRFPFQGLNLCSAQMWGPSHWAAREAPLCLFIAPDQERLPGGVQWQEGVPAPSMALVLGQACTRPVPGRASPGCSLGTRGLHRVVSLKRSTHECPPTWW